MQRSRVLLGAIVFLVAAFAGELRADTMYSYSGQPLTHCLVGSNGMSQSDCANNPFGWTLPLTSGGVQGSFTTSVPLPNDFNGLLEYSNTINTLGVIVSTWESPNASYPEPFYTHSFYIGIFQTDANGIPTSWTAYSQFACSIYVWQPCILGTILDSKSTSSSAGDNTEQDGWVIDPLRYWGPSGSWSVGEPSDFWLLASGLIGLAWMICMHSPRLNRG